jgi:membrane protein YqaA with SNARE-associated domain
VADPESLLFALLLLDEVTLHFLDRLNHYLVVMGIPGVLAISFLDSAAIPTIGGPDAVILLLCWQQPSLELIIAAAGAIGSTLGCLVLYSIGQKSGEKALARFSARKIDWVKGKMDRGGVWAVIAGVIAPPPFPTKLLVLAAGVLRTGKLRFASAVFAGRFVRYSIVAYLGGRFHSAASNVLKENYPLISLILICGILLGYLIRAMHNATGVADDPISPQGK